MEVGAEVGAGMWVGVIMRVGVGVRRVAAEVSVGENSMPLLCS